MENVKANSNISHDKADMTSAKTPSAKARNGLQTPKTKGKQRQFGSTTKSLDLSFPATPSTPSAFSAREAAKQAKAQYTAEKIRRTSELKEKWAKEKEEKLRRISEKRSADHRHQQKLLEASAEQRRRELEIQRETANRKKQEKLAMIRSAVEEKTQLQEDLAAEQLRRRRKSVALNTEILNRARAKEEELARLKKEEEDSLLQSRRIDYLQVRETKLMEEERRRESMIFRGKEARRQRSVTQQQIALEQQRKEDILNVRKEMWRDDHEAQQLEREKEHDELSNRLDEWREQKRIQMELENAEKTKLGEELEKRRSDWQDIQKYKAEQRERDRQSLIGRLDKWREERSIEEQLAEEEREREAMAHDLFLEEYEDVLDYYQEQEANRRQSLAYRLEVAKREAEWEVGQEALRARIEAEERDLAAKERADIEAYRQRLAEERRQSLAFRLTTQTKHRMYDEGMTANLMLVREEEAKLQSQVRNDVMEYKQAMRAKERQSIAARIQKSRKDKEIDLELHRQHLNNMHTELEEKRQNWLALRSAEEEQKARSRKSISYRLESWRQCKMQSEKRKAKQRIIEEQNRQFKEMDFVDTQQAKYNLQEEERQNIIKGRMLI